MILIRTCASSILAAVKHRAGFVFRVLVLPLVVSAFLSATAQASAIDDIKIQTLPDGYELSLNSLYSYLFKSTTPVGQARKFYIRLKTNNFQNLTTEEVDDIHENVIPAWDHTTGLPMQELRFDGDDAENPQLALVFTEDVEVDVHSSADLKTLIIKVKTAKAPASVTLESQEGTAIPLPEAAVSGEQPAEASLMEEAKDALTKGEYDKAVELYLKILSTAQGDVKRQAQELLGVSRERNGQLAHAAAAYQTYLKDYPKGPDADRVRQRLAGVVTADQAPKGALKETLTSSEKVKAEQALWTSQYFGSISQFYYWDETKPHGGKAQTTVNNLSNDMDFNARWKSKQFDVSSRFTGGVLKNYREGVKDEERISALSVDVKAKDAGFYTRIGRQTLSSGGVLGRFDGIHASQQLNRIMKLNGVFGFPVDSVKNTTVQTDRHFGAVSIDWGAPKQKWAFNTYAVDQQNTGLTDRRAVGGEMRYFDPHKVFFTMLDYDVYFKTLNIGSFNGHWTLPSKTTLTLSGDYRKTPLLTTNNAIQGMGVNSISELTDRFTMKELRRLALDRTTNSKSLSFGISQDLKENLQWTGDVTVSSLEGTIASQGVEGTKSTDPEYTYTTELIASNLFKEEDSFITGLAYTDAVASNDYSVNLNWRYPLTKRVRVNPKLRVGYRTQKETSDHRTTIRPLVHFDIRLTKATNLELEGGAEWVSEIATGERQRSYEDFVTVGYRFSF